MLDWIKNGFSIPFHVPVTQPVVPVNVFSHKENDAMFQSICKLKSIGAISECDPDINQFISKIFLTPKPDGGKRFILNLKPLNKFIKSEHFKMEDYRTACKLIPHAGYLATIDLKDAFFLIPVRASDRNYLRFQFQSNSSAKLITYQFNSVPFGLSVAPRVFTKVMKEVMTHLRYRGFTNVFYLDDILCIGDSYNSCSKNVTETLKLLECLGFVVNLEKSNIIPQQVCKFLGFQFNTVNLTMCLPTDKREKIAMLVKKFIKLPTCTIREFAQLIGVLVAACPAAKYGWTYTKILERQKYLALLKTCDYETKFTLPKITLKDLNWWSANIDTTFNFIRHGKFEIEIYSDASRTGWGAVCKNHKVHGMWNETEKLSHINYLELMAAFLGLKAFARELTDCSILLRIDNTTAISYINRMGGIQYPHLNSLARDLWQWCETRSLWIFASYVNTKDNRADAASRIINPDTEWVLSKGDFQKVVSHFGQPKIDLFASRDNAKCAKYVSWKQDPDAFSVDAFTLNWRTEYFYAFPPFSLILKCLRKIIDDKAVGILVYPNWPSQPWYPLLQSLLVSDVLFLNPNKNLLRSNFRAHHPLHRKLTLGVARLSGNPSSDAVPLQTLLH